MFFNKKKLLNTNTVFFISGCSSGFGKALCIEILKKGYNLVATARNLDDLNYLQNHNNALCVSMDITKPSTISEAIRKALYKFSHIDVCINNAGIDYMSDFVNASDENIRKIFETNIFGTINVCKEIVPIMRKQQRGTILNVSSQSGFFSTYGAFFYSVSKYAIEGISSNLRREFDENKENIKVITVNPGAYKTDILKKCLENGKKKFNDYSDYPSFTGDVNVGAQKIIKCLEQGVPTRIILGNDAIHKFKKHYKLIKNELKYNLSIND